MEWYGWLIVVLAFLGVGAVGMIFATMNIARGVYEDLLVRTSPQKWSRECSAPEIEEHYAMYLDGMQWGNDNMSNMVEVEIKNDGLRLFGEYFDFGFKKAVIIIPGRNEGLRYSYYFAFPYRVIGYNVLVIDIRAHGMSEGIYDSVGYHEQYDVIKWMELLRDEYGVEEFAIHGLCIGGATAIYVAANEACPKELGAIICEGPFSSFYDVLTQRMHTLGKPVFPVREELRYLIKKYAGTDVKRYTPMKRAGRVKVPTLFICGRKDVSSLPEKCEKLFDRIGSEHKRLVWFDEGEHSHLRVNNLPQYDEVIADFLGGLGQTE